MVSKWVISPTYKWGIPWGYNPLILTIDPNFQRYIQAWGVALRSSVVCPRVEKTVQQKNNGVDYTTLDLDLHVRC